MVDLARLWLVMLPKMSLDNPGLALNKFREIASSPKMAALDLMLAVGVEGLELFPVENLNKP
jgi:hypothetical protein